MRLCIVQAFLGGLQAQDKPGGRNQPPHLREDGWQPLGENQLEPLGENQRPILDQLESADLLKVRLHLQVHYQLVSKI